MKKPACVMATPEPVVCAEGDDDGMKKPACVMATPPEACDEDMMLNEAGDMCVGHS